MIFKHIVYVLRGKRYLLERICGFSKLNSQFKNMKKSFEMGFSKFSTNYSEKVENCENRHKKRWEKLSRLLKFCLTFLKFKFSQLDTCSVKE